MSRVIGVSPVSSQGMGIWRYVGGEQEWAYVGWVNGPRPWYYELASMRHDLSE
jgi:hypothetical protein